MTIDEAIQLLKESHKHNYAWRGSKLDIAIQLGIEALKRLKEQRVLEACERNYLLPGETECL